MKRNLSVPIRVSTLALAVALVAGPSPSAAESLKGTPNVTFGTANITEGALTTDVDISTSQVVVDWTPDDNAVGNFGAISFQDAGTTATFHSATDFAVLNRLNVADPTRIVALNGTINGLVNGQTGGAIYFYSPSGFVATGTAVFNVGSLVLSALPITVDGQGNFINNGTVAFGQAPNPNAAINTVSDINGTAQINASGAGSYVALVAPQILHQGDIKTDGAAALVAAEAATITFSPSGLFDIQVTTGTDAATGIHVDGGTIDRNSATEGVFNHRAYLVAVAKNDAVTMLVNNGGSVGFDTATSASVENNVVVLSGGYDIQAGDHWTYSGTSQVDLTISNATLSSDVDAKMTGGVAINSGEGALSFGGDLTAIGGARTTTGGNVLIDGLNGNALSIAGNLHARAFRKNADGSDTGLITRLGASGGSTVTIGGDVNLDSDSFGAPAADNGLNGTSATGGNAQVNIGANSTLNVTGSVTVHADGYGGDNIYSDGAGGNGTGGQALLMSIFGNATVNVGGSVYVSAQGFGGSAGECSVCNITGGNGKGGNASVHTNVGVNQMHLTSDVTISAAGYGGAGDAQAGTGTGGTANLGASDGSVLTVGTDIETEIDVDASGFGGYGFNNVGGLGQGGLARISAGTNANSLVELNGTVFVSADGLGGDATNGGTGTGGQAQVNAILGTVHAFNDVFVTAESLGGFGNTDGTGGSGLADIETAVSPEMTEASMFVSGGTLIVDGLTAISANATGGDGGFNGGDGGNAVAGGIAGTNIGGAVIHAANNDTATSVIQLGTVVITADAEGGQGGDGQGGTNGSDGGNGGSATGGKAVITAAAGSGDITAGTTILSASATGGNGGFGGNGDGGDGGNGGNGGTATGGFINAGSESGNTNFAQGANNGTATYTTIVAFTTATGGNGGDGGFGNIAGVGGSGGDAFGGNSVLLVRGSDVTVTGANLDASAFGGNGGLSPNAPDGDGGDATAGGVGVIVTNRFNLPNQRGTLTAGDITGTATATGGAGGLGNGLSLSIGGNQFVVRNSDATINNISLVNTADTFDGGSQFASSSPIEIQNGTIDVNGQFVFQSLGNVSMWNDSGTLNAGQIIVDGDNFIHDEFFPVPVSLGTFAANNIFLTTGQDLIVDGHMVILNGAGFTAPGLIDFDNVTSTNGPLTLDAGETVTAGNLLSGDLLAVTAGGNVTLGTVNALGGQALIDSSGGSINAGNIDAADFIGLNALTTITTGNLNAATFVFGQSDGSILTGNIDAGTTIDIFSNAADITTGDLLAGTDITLDAVGDIQFGDVQADTIDFDSGGAVTGGNIVAGTSATGSADGAVNLGDINVGILLAGGPSDDGFAVGIVSGTSIDVGNVDADEAIGFATLGNLTAGNLNAGTDVMALVGGNTSIGSITTPNAGRTYLADAQMFLDAGGPGNFDPSPVFAATPLRSGGAITISGPVSTGRFQAAAASITTNAITAPIGIYLDSANSTSTGALTSAGPILAFGDGSIQTGNIDSGDIIVMDAGSSLGFGDLTAVAGISLDAGTSINGGNVITGTGFEADALGGSITLGNVDAVNFLVMHAAGNVTTGDLDSGNGNVWADAQAGSTTVGDVIGGSVDLTATGSVSAGDVQSNTGWVFARADNGSLTIGNIDAATFTRLLSPNGPITAGNIDASTSAELEAQGAIIFGNVVADTLDFDTGGTVTGGDILAGTRAGGDASGAINLGNISVGIELIGGPAEDGFAVGFASGTSINVGNVEADEAIGFATLGNLSAGNLNAGTNVMALIGNNISLGSITTPSNGRTYLADVSMFIAAGGSDNFDPSVVFNAAPVATGGSIAIGGPVNTGRFQAAAGTALTALAINAQSIEARAGGLMSINGIWSAPFLDLWSDDLDIAANGGIDAGNTGSIRLVSTNATQAQIGDGLSGTGYKLTNAEFGRISGGSVQIAARDNASSAIDMLIGDLGVTGPAAGSTIDDPFGSLVFATGDPATQAAGGVIRIVGDVNATGFTDTNSIEFYTGRFELDAATGSISIEGLANTLSGELYIEADRIHVASGSILDQLAVNPHYSGYQNDLNAPAAVQRPDGVIRAGSIDVLPTDAVLVQNTGTADTPAGFLTFADGPLFSDIEGTIGPIELIINGQLITESGTLTGIDVRDFLIDENNVGLFTENSTINGCTLTGDCLGGGNEGPFPPGFTPTPGIQDKIVLIDDNLLPPEDFGNEDFIDDNDEESDDSGPIEPPQPLFDTTELGDESAEAGPEVGTSMRSSPSMKDSGDVDDPVSGSGNPGLMETPPSPPSQEEKQ